METGLSINKYIYAILSKNDNLRKYVDLKIYPLVAEESTTFPFIIFRKDSINTFYTKDGRSNDEVEFSVAIIALNYIQTVDIAEEVRKSLELYRNQYFKEIRLNGVNEDFIDNSYVLELRFKAII